MRISIDGEQWKAHRYVWATTVGPIPEGLCVLHHCDRPACIEITHLYLGTDSDNTRDRVRRGRNGGPRRGEGHHHAVLTQESVDAIREEYGRGGVPQAELAGRYGVSQMTISKVVRRETWQ